MIKKSHGSGISNALFFLGVVLFAQNSWAQAPNINYASPQTYTEGKAITALKPTNTGGPVPAGFYAQVSTFAGNGFPGSANGTGAAASFNGPQGIAIDMAGNIYVADGYNNLIRKITAAGVVSTFAGSGAAGSANGKGTAASFKFPQSLAVDTSGNVFVADSQNGLIRKITAAGVVSTYAGGGIKGLSLPYPADVAVDAAGDLFIADGGSSVYEITSAGIAKTLASGYNYPFGVAVDGAGFVYFTDFSDRVFKINNNGDGQVTVIAGTGMIGSANGAGAAASFDNPNDLKVDAQGNIYVADTYNSLVRKITPAGLVTTLAGSGDTTSANGIGTAADLNNVFGIALDGKGNLFVSTKDNLIRRILLTGYGISPALPAGLSMNNAGAINGTPVITSASANYTITAGNSSGSGTAAINITINAPAGQQPPVINYASPQTYTEGKAITALKPTNTGGAVPAGFYAQVSTFAGSGFPGSANGTGTAASFNQPAGVAIDKSGNIYIADQDNNLIRKITPAGVVTTFAGSGAAGAVNGTGTSASFNHPLGLIFDAAGNLYVADSYNGMVRKISPAGVVTTLASGFTFPADVAVDGAGYVYEADGGTSIQKISPAGVVSVFAKGFTYPFGVTVDAAGNVFVSDFTMRIFRISPAGIVSVLAGSGQTGSANGMGTAASFNNPNGLKVDAAGNLFVADTYNNRIREVSPAGVVTTLAGSGDSTSTNGVGIAAGLNNVFYLALDGQGNLFASTGGDANTTGNDLVRKITLTGYGISPALPAGLTMDATGAISGTPTAVSGSTNYTVTAGNSSGAGTANITITVNNSEPVSKSPDIYTIAGNGSNVFNGDGGPAALAALAQPYAMVMDKAGNIFIATEDDSRVRRIDAVTKIITTVAGTGVAGFSGDGGPAVNAQLNFFNALPGLYVDAAGNLYIGDCNNNRVRKIDAVTQTISTIAGTGIGGYSGDGGLATAAELQGPGGILIDAGNNIYIADVNNLRIRKIDVATHNISTVISGLGYVERMTLDKNGNLYFGDEGKLTINEIDAVTHQVSVIAGTGASGYSGDGGPAIAAQFRGAMVVVLDSTGNIYVGDQQNNVIRKIDAVTHIISTYAGIGSQGYSGDGGPAVLAQMNYLTDIVIDKSGYFYVDDLFNNVIRRIGGTASTQTITFTAIPPKIYGTADFDPATANSGLPVSYTSSNTLVASIVSGKIHIVGVGQTTITALQAGNANYRAAKNIAQTLTVTPAPLTVTANSTTGIAGVAIPAFSVSYSGFVNGDTQSSISNRPIISTTATLKSPAGNYPITVSGGTSANYTFIDVPGTLVLAPSSYLSASLPVQTYGNADFPEFGTRPPGLTYTSSNPAVATIVAGNIHITGAGTSTIIASNGSNQISKTLTVNKAPLTVTANSNTGIAGVAIPAFSVSYSGFVNGDTPGSISSQPVASTTATLKSPAGNYPITVSGGISANYTFIDVPGTLVLAPSAYLSASIPVQTYGNADFPEFGTRPPGLTYTSSNAAVATIVAGNIHITGAGTSTIIASNGSNQISKTLTVNKAPLTVTANNLVKVQGTVNPALTLSYSGFVNGDTNSNLTAQPILSTAANALSTPGVYPITVSGAASPNYAFTYVNGTLTILLAPPVISYPGPQIFTIGVTTPPIAPANTGGAAAAGGYTISPALPAGLLFNSNTGLINGTPTTVSPSTIYTVTATNAAGSDTARVNITVNNNPVIGALRPPFISYPGPQIFTTGAATPPIAPTNTGGAVPAGIYAQVSAFAGSGMAGATNGTGTAASFTSPWGLTTDPDGNVYVSDIGNNLIRKITPAGAVTTFAGSGAIGSANGTGTAASFNFPLGLASDTAGNIYVADAGNNLIRKITPAGVVTTLAGSGAAGLVNGTGTTTAFHTPTGLAIDTAGNIYVGDAGNNVIRKITPSGVVSTFAGNLTAGSANGTGTAASFNQPYGLAVDAAGNLYVADQGNNQIRKITPAGVVTTLAGSGEAGAVDGVDISARFNKPYSVAADGTGNVYVADFMNNEIRMVNAAGTVSTLAGTVTAGSANGTGTAAGFSNPQSAILDGAGNIYVADGGNHLIRKIAVTGYTISPALPSGITFNGTTGLISGTPTAISPATNYTITAYNAAGSGTATINITINNPVIAALKPPVITYPGPQTFTTGTATPPIAPSNTGGAVPAKLYGQVSTFAGSGATGSANGLGTAASFNLPIDVAADAMGNIYVGDTKNNLIRKISPAGEVSTFAGSGAKGKANGAGNLASFNNPQGIVIDAAGNVYVSDENNNLIRKITPAGVVSTFAGSGAAGAANGADTLASFNGPGDMTIDPSGNIYVTDQFNNLVRKITPAGVVSTYAGNGTTGATNGTAASASFNSPIGIAIDLVLDIYVSEFGNNMVRKITASGVVSTFAGTGAAGSSNGAGIAASFNQPGGLAVDASGNVYVADFANNLVRKISAEGVVTTLAGSGATGANNGIGAAATFNSPAGDVIDGLGNLYVCEAGNNLIRKIVVTGYTISPALPPGLNLDSSTGLINGTPTTVSPATNYTITAYNSAGSGSAVLNIGVNAIAGQSIGEPIVHAAVSPNGDGVNDVLTIDHITNYPENKLTLMNSSGVKVFELGGYDNVNKVFDGHSNINGKKQLPGTYFYMLSYEDKGVTKNKTGYIILKY